MFKNFLLAGALVSLVGCASNVNVKGVVGGLGTSDSLADLELNLDVKKEYLSNGMKVLIVENKRLPIFSMYTFFDVGGRYEYPGTTGATHFLEHMLFKRTKNFPPEYFSKFIELNGGSSNAYTTFDNTVYYQNLPSSTFDDIVNLEADRLENLILDQGDFDKEKQVVLEERKMRYENSPRGQIYLKMMKTMFKGTPYGGSVIGDAKDVKGLTREKMMEFYDKFYAPNNATMVIVGDVDASDVISTLEKKIGKIKKNEKLEQLKASLDKDNRYKPNLKLPVVKSIKGQSETPLFTLSFPGLKYGEEDGFALDFLSSILSEGESSYLFQKFVKGRRPKVSSIYAANYSLKNGGVFFIQGLLLDRVNLRKFRRSLKRSLSRSCKEAVTERSVAKTKNQILARYYKEIKTNAGLASFLGNQEFFSGDYKNYEKELKIYNSMNVAKVKDVCRRYLNVKNSAFLSVWKRH